MVGRLWTFLRGFPGRAARSTRVAAKRVTIRPLFFLFILTFFVAGEIVFGDQGRAQAQSPLTYYVDCSAGVDTNAGTTTAQAWKSINKANSATLRPGDKMLFKRGCSWVGPLTLKWQGTAAQPVTIGAYGSGELPKIRDSYSGNVQITGSYQVVEYLEATLTVPPSPVAACQNQPIGWKSGFSFGATATYNTLQYSKADKLTIGVYLHTSSHHNKILHNTIVDNNVLEDLTATAAHGATGISLHGEYQEIGYNYFSGNRSTCTYNGVIESNSIELYTASYSNIHHNISIGDRVFSELGSTSTYRSVDNTFAYNVHVVGPMASSTGARFIVTRGDGHSNGPVWRTKLYNNTVYFTGDDSKAVSCQKCSSDVLSVENNILWAEYEPIASDGPFIEDNNVLWSSDGTVAVKFTKSSTTKLANPSFVDANNNNFHLNANSPAINAGNSQSVAAGYVNDLDMVAVPQAQAVDIGSYEVPQAATPTATPTNTPTATPTPSATPVGTTPAPTPSVTTSPTPSATPSPTPSPTPSATPSPTPAPTQTLVPSLPACSISLNNGAIYTGQAAVQVQTNMPEATQMLVGTDAGFAGAQWQPYQAQFSWTLPDTGGRIATLLVYVRFSDGAGSVLCGGGQVSDDIIYDPLAPTLTVNVSNAALAAAVSKDAAVAADGSTVESQPEIEAELAVNAVDQENGSGVEWMQVSPDPEFGDPTWQRYNPAPLVSGAPGQTLYVRVQDGSGNNSQAVAVTLPGNAGQASNALFLPMVSH